MGKSKAKPKDKKKYVIYRIDDTDTDTFSEHFPKKIIMQKFFAENNVGYNASKGLKTVKELAEDLLHSAETPEKAADLAKKMCFEFKKMHDAPEGDRWHNVPLFPVCRDI